MASEWWDYVKADISKYGDFTLIRKVADKANFDSKGKELIKIKVFSEGDPKSRVVSSNGDEIEFDVVVFNCKHKATPLIHLKKRRLGWIRTSVGCSRDLFYAVFREAFMGAHVGKRVGFSLPYEYLVNDCRVDPSCFIVDGVTVAEPGDRISYNFCLKVSRSEYSTLK
eukprot:gnl/Carplike_NY0171/4299_a5826_403.p1 GENE.gnl/Carplike_NY0171/4299_a5826_403~~gnl/Carplike_NY0171/4299_a5826_403.p1  ORF type:complete len:168 (+),score=13.00 gnl/Carplike_NY0171/4299_a5826_403:16-519(+)